LLKRKTASSSCTQKNTQHGDADAAENQKLVKEKYTSCGMSIQPMVQVMIGNELLQKTKEKQYAKER